MDVPKYITHLKMCELALYNQYSSLSCFTKLVHLCLIVKYEDHFTIPKPRVIDMPPHLHHLEEGQVYFMFDISCLSQLPLTYVNLNQDSNYKHLPKSIIKLKADISAAPINELADNFPNLREAHCSYATQHTTSSSPLTHITILEISQVPTIPLPSTITHITFMCPIEHDISSPSPKPSSSRVDNPQN